MGKSELDVLLDSLVTSAGLLSFVSCEVVGSQMLSAASGSGYVSLACCCSRSCANFDFHLRQKFFGDMLLLFVVMFVSADNSDRSSTHMCSKANELHP